MQLVGEKRLNNEEERFKRILKCIRCETDDDLNDDDINYIMYLHLAHLRFSDEDREKIEKDALYIFANKEPKNELNRYKLFVTNSSDKPVATISSITKTRSGRLVTNNSHFDVERSPAKVLICISAKVSLLGINIDPKVGLYHRAIGTVLDIVYYDGESPNEGNMPAYVLVEFPQYTGKPIISHLPKAVPISAVEIKCKRNCCTRKYIPLTLAYRKTAHTFQGQTTGPVYDSKRPKNQIERIIIDPGTRLFEGNNVGCFYTMCSHGTSCGKETGSENDKFTSAIYFNSNNMCKHRITKLTIGSDGKIYHKAMLRNLWVKYLKTNIIHNDICKEDQLKLFEWAKSTKINCETLKKIEKLYTTK